jgi:hypothetical protein
MGKGKTVSFLRGKRIRATMLDGAGRPLIGDSSVVTSKGFTTLGMTTNSEDGEAISQTNANGESCILETAVTTFTGIGLEIEFCGVDFSLFTMLTGQEIVLDENGVAVGIEEATGVDLGDVNFALEMWLGAQTDATPGVGSQGFFGYVVLPRVGGGTISDVSVENGAINLTITGMSTKDNNQWGKGPYNVDLVGGVAAPLFKAIKPKAHRRIMIVEIAPPEVFDGATPLLDPTDPAVTGLTTTPTLLSVSIAPTPAGTDPMWYDFGDGQWDYAETGSYTHEYDAPGTYVITGHRGSSTVTKSVTVSE